MRFAEKYIASLSSQNLRDDAFHHDLDAVAAAALAGDMGALLCRVKYADGTVSRLFEGNAGNLAQLLRAWTAAVAQKGRARRWVKAQTAWDAQAATTLYRRVAEASLAHWLDSKCKVCHGTGIVAAMPVGCLSSARRATAAAKAIRLFRRFRTGAHQGTWSASSKASSSRTARVPCAASVIKKIMQYAPS